MTRDDEIVNRSIDYGQKTPSEYDDGRYDLSDLELAFEEGAKWAEKEFAKKVQRFSISYKYDTNLAIKAHVGKEMIHDRLLIRLIERLKRDGYVEIKETQEDDVSTISMCVNVLKNDFKQAIEE